MGPSLCVEVTRSYPTIIANEGLAGAPQTWRRQTPDVDHVEMARRRDLERGRVAEAVNMQLGGYEARQRALDPLAEKRFVVDVFGSMSWGGQTGKGDIDLVIRVGEGDIVRFVVTAS
jgi:hypothetical protein